MNSTETIIDGWDGIVNEVPNPNDKMKIEGVGYAIESYGLGVDLNPIRL